MRKRLSFCLLLCASLTAGAAVILPSHPRLLLRSEDLPALRKRFEHADFATLRTSLEAQRNYGTTGLAAGGVPDERIRQKMEALALAYLLDPEASRSAGLEAVALARGYLGSLRSVSGYSQNLYCYEAVFGAAMVYDWCHAVMGAADKADLIAQMKRCCSLAEYSPEKGTPTDYLSGHYGELGPSVFLAVGIATQDEDRQYFDFAYREQVESFAPSRNPMYEAETHHQGAQYIHVRYFSELLQAYLLEKVGLNPYSPKISLSAYRGIYNMVPQVKDMDGMPEGDCHNSLGMGYFPIYNLAAQLSRDPFLQIFSKSYLAKSANYSARAFVYHDPEIPAESLANLRLSRYFPSPSGILIARTGWTVGVTDYSSKDMVVLMNMREYSTKNHVHLDVGHFSVYYKGHLALDSGIYQGGEPQNEWGKDNYVNYYARTIAHNSLLLLDPDEPLPYEGWNVRAKARDGGQFSLKNVAFKTSQEMFAAGKLAQVLAQDIAPGVAPEYSYLKGDMTRAYNIPSNVAIYPGKAETLRRSFVFLNLGTDSVPGALIVMDRVVSSKPEFRKTWLLHSQNEPVVGASSIEFSSTAGGRNGKLRNDILLPEQENQSLVKIGGPGSEYWVDGKNWGGPTQEDAGCWRMELSPRTASKADNFLNVIQVMDAVPAGLAFEVRKVKANKGDYVAVEIADRIVAQQLQLGIQTRELEFNLGDPKRQYKVLVTDLRSGDWLVSGTDGELRVTVRPESGTASFTAAGGLIRLRFDEGSVPGLQNLSVLAEMGAGEELTMGMVMKGGAREILARAGGPALEAFGVTQVLADPGLHLYAGGTLLAENEDWSPELQAHFSSVGAFNFKAGSKDAALVRRIDGPTTVRLQGAGGGGTAIAETYALGSGSLPRLSNLSVLHRVGARPLVAGFVVGGSPGSVTLLVRGLGPALAPFGVSEPLQNPLIRLYREQTELSSNDNWTPDLLPTMAQLGAFALPSGSKDSALLVTVPLGAYTVHLSGADGGKGNGLVEVYVVD